MIWIVKNLWLISSLPLLAAGVSSAIAVKSRNDRDSRFDHE